MLKVRKLQKRLEFSAEFFFKKRFKLDRKMYRDIL